MGVLRGFESDGARWLAHRFTSHMAYGSNIISFRCDGGIYMRSRDRSSDGGGVGGMHIDAPGGQWWTDGTNQKKKKYRTLLSPQVETGIEGGCISTSRRFCILLGPRYHHP